MLKTQAEITKMRIVTLKREKYINTGVKTAHTSEVSDK